MNDIFEDRARHWHLFGPPARPSAREARIFQELAEALEPRPRRALVLGCTPELRDVAHGVGIALCCVDRSAGMFGALAALKQEDGPEEFVAGDWRALPDFGEADLVLADGSFNMLDAEGRRRLAAALAARLPPGARMLCRVHLRGEQRFQSVERIVEHHRAHPPGVPFFSAIRTDLDMLWLDPSDGALDLGEMGRRLLEMRGEGLFTDAEWSGIGPLVALNRITLHYSSRREMLEMLGGAFELLGEHVADDYPRADLHPVWHLRRRSEC